jgi:hypothetical protein
MEKIAVRAPHRADFALSLRDMVTLRSAPPLLFAAATLFLLTGNVIVSALAVTVTSYAHALWARLIEAKESSGV